LSVPAYKITDRRSSYGYTNNLLIKAATNTDQRPSIPFVDYDQTRNVSTLGRRILLSTGRMLFENFGVVKGAVQEAARHSVGTFIPQFFGQNEAWGRMAQEWLDENDKWIDLKGWPYTYDNFKRQLVISVIRDGELGTILTQDAQGNPKIQVMGSHRIGSRINEYVVIYPKGNVLKDGSVIAPGDGRVMGNIAWDGMAIIDGVIVDDFGTPQAYRITGDIPSNYSQWRDISTNDFVISFLPDYPESVRGFSMLGVAAFDMLDVSESSKRELFAQLINASQSLQIYNETGDVDLAKSIITDSTTTPDTVTGAATGLPKELVQPGQINYFKAGSGQKLESFSNERPSVNVMNFQAETLRRALSGFGWSTDFSLDPSKVGGAQMRIVIEKINARILEFQNLLVGPTCARVDAWRCAKAIKAGRLPFDPEWYKWGYQGPPELTADEKYSSDVAIQEFRGGPLTMKKWAGRNGDQWKDAIRQKVAERKFLEDECKKQGVLPDDVLLMTPNGTSAADMDPGTSADPAAKPKP
jgi:capsid protein